jgi:hypothetical protein
MPSKNQAVLGGPKSVNNAIPVICHCCTYLDKSLPILFTHFWYVTRCRGICCPDICLYGRGPPEGEKKRERMDAGRRTESLGGRQSVFCMHRGQQIRLTRRRSHINVTTPGKTSENETRRKSLPVLNSRKVDGIRRHNVSRVKTRPQISQSTCEGGAEGDFWATQQGQQGLAAHCTFMQQNGGLVGGPWTRLGRDGLAHLGCSSAHSARNRGEKPRGGVQSGSSRNVRTYVYKGDEFAWGRSG